MWYVNVMRDDKWATLDEGPWEEKEDAEAFVKAEVGVKAVVVRDRCVELNYVCDFNERGIGSISSIELNHIGIPMDGLYDLLDKSEELAESFEAFVSEYFCGLMYVTEGNPSLIQFKRAHKFVHGGNEILWWFEEGSEDE